MIELGPATEDEMILAFLQGEIDSPRFGNAYNVILRNSGLDRTAIAGPDLQSARENYIRHELLRVVRGYGDDSFLFQGFPADLTWRRVQLDAGDYQRLRYANHDTWVNFSGGSRVVSDGARNIALITATEDANTNIRAVAAALQAGIRYAPLIAVDGPSGSMILIEGHTRATAYVIECFEPFEVIIGSSPVMNNWALY